MKRKLFNPLFIVGVVLFLTSCNLGLILSPLPDTVQEQVDQALDYGADGMIVYVDKTGQSPELYSSGWKNRENQIPADPQSLFKIASISKLYIATASAKLIDANEISPDATLSELLPELENRIQNSTKITFEMLLQHKSGIPDFMDDPEYPWASPPETVDETLEIVLDKPAVFPPGFWTSYSNTNYLLIGKILDKVLGYDHQLYIRAEILDPLNLNHTFGRLSDVDIDDVMSGYSVEYGPDIKYNDFVAPGGSMVATAQDVGIFLRALNDGSLLTDSEQAIYSSVYVYEHTGLLPGYQSIARYYRDIDTVIIQFMNTSGGNMWSTSETIYDRIVQIVRSK